MIDILNLKPHEVSTDLTGYAIGIYGGPGLGKAQPNCTIIPTLNGFKNMGEIKVGDYVFNRKGQPVRVLGVYPQGKKPIYKLWFSDGREAFSCEDHLWTYVTDQGNFITVPLKEILDNPQQYYNCRIPVAEPVQFPTKTLTFDPYMVGVLMMSGTSNIPKMLFNIHGEVVVQQLQEFYFYDEVRHCLVFKKIWFPDESDEDRRDFRIIERDLVKLIETKYNNGFTLSFLSQYLTGSVKQRFSLLQGMVDAGGYIDTNRQVVVFNNQNLRNAEIISDLAKSLGFNVFKIENDTNYDIEIKGIKNNSKLSRHPTNIKMLKKWDIEDETQINTINLVDITYSHVEEATCILVEDLEHLYVTEDFIVTHNTTTALQAEKPLLIAAEKGYKTISGTMAVDVNSWPDILTVVSQLKKPEAQELYKTIVIDTLDELVFYAEQYILQANGVSKPTDIPYGGFYVQIEQMFRKLFKDLTRYYGLIIVAHADLKMDEDDPERKLKYATLAVNKKVKKIVMGLLDLLIFVEGDRSRPGVTTMHFKSSQNWEAKSRFPNIVDSDILSYNNIVKCINNAIGDVATAPVHKQYYPENNQYTKQDYEEIRTKVDAVAKAKVEEHGLSPVVELINTVLGKKIVETDIADTPALLVLLEELETL
jgi:hypothetical protein